MNGILCFFLLVALQEVPLKPLDEFDVKLDYQFKQRPPVDKNTVRLGEPVSSYERRSSTAVLPYLVLNIHLLKLPEEKMRMRVTTNLSERGTYKKVSQKEVVELDLGFTDDMVDRVTAHQYIVTFLNGSRQPVDRIVIAVEDDGSFLINGEKRGKF